jgi:hypothetical protein
MKAALLVLGVLLATTAIAPRANAQNYPWCAIYDGSFGGKNCGFTTYEQCMATVSGIGGFCNQNTMYDPPPGEHPHKTVHKTNS